MPRRAAHAPQADADAVRTRTAERQPRLGTLISVGVLGAISGLWCAALVSRPVAATAYGSHLISALLVMWPPFLLVSAARVSAFELRANGGPSKVTGETVVLLTALAAIAYFGGAVSLGLLAR